MEEVTDAQSTVDRIDALLDRVRRDAIKQAHLSANTANAVSDRFGLPRVRVVVYLRSGDAPPVTCSAGGT